MGWQKKRAICQEGSGPCPWERVLTEFFCKQMYEASLVCAVMERDDAKATTVELVTGTGNQSNGRREMLSSCVHAYASTWFVSMDTILWCHHCFITSLSS